MKCKYDCGFGTEWPIALLNHERWHETTHEERFLRFFEEGEGCWEWQGGRTTQGYGCFTVDQQNVLAHRFSWETTHGPIPEGLFVLHRCDNPPCVRPDHLFLGSQKANVRDMRAKGRANFREHQTHCKRGHPLTPDNTYSGRRCKTCILRRSRERHQRRKAAR